jgi:hypothetical protein
MIEAGSDDSAGYGHADREASLSSLSDGLLREAIREQVFRMPQPGPAAENLMSVLYDRHAVLSSVYEGDADAAHLLSSALAAATGSAARAICERFALGRDEDVPVADFDLRHLYRFLVADYRRNIVSFIVGYVLENRKALAAEYRLPGGRRDLAASAVRKSVSSQDDAVILSKIEEIIEGAAMTVDSPEALIAIIHSADPDSEHLTAITRLLAPPDGMGSIWPTSDFCPEFLRPAVEESEAAGFASEVRADLSRRFSQ